ncbi:MAG: sarcosine oxidase subunit delta, partial [Xanthomonadales bacterium]|nr:sarcosine oxidase subunit delta [Xanthomonadales bacterium]
PCPYCGVRDQDEFRYGGEAPIVRPADPEQATDAEWADYLFYRDNIKGPRLERWLHRHGCRQWFLVRRDTLTHEISEILGFDEYGDNG